MQIINTTVMTDNKIMRLIVAAIITLALCIPLAIGAVHLYRAYRVADVISDEAAQDNVERFMTGAYTGYRELTEEEKDLFRDTYKGDEKLDPMSVATQVVAGINYRFACTDQNDGEYVVTIYKPLPGHGDPSVTSVEPRPAGEQPIQ